MKAVGLNVVFEVRMGVVPDALNGTTLLVNDTPVWGCRKCEATSHGMVSLGDVVDLRIPSGTLVGEVTAILVSDEEETLILENASWQGKAGGLAGGKCAVGVFEVTTPDEATVIGSSAIERPIPYSVYEKVRRLVGGYDNYGKTWISHIIDPRYKAEAMRQILRSLGWGSDRLIKRVRVERVNDVYALTTEDGLFYIPAEGYEPGESIRLMDEGGTIIGYIAAPEELRPGIQDIDLTLVQWEE